MNTQSLSNQKQRGSDLHRSGVRIPTTFYYQIANMKAMKIVVLIKISKLKYELEEMVENGQLFYLKTQKGILNKEYEIIDYIINESKENEKIASMIKGSYREDSRQVREEQLSCLTNENDEELAVNLSGEDHFLQAKMMEILFQLRTNLFPLLEEFYKYLLGHERIKKIKYESLINKIKTQITKLDAHIIEHSDVYSYQNSFLNIIIACELFMGCKFVFEQKFRKSKYSLFRKYEKISKKPEFQQIYGKTTMCLKEYVPPEFQIEEDSPLDQNIKKADQLIPQDIIKMSEQIVASSCYQSDRNELLYGYFRSVFSQGQNKRSYFPYFWLMFDSLSCNLIQIVYQNSNSSGLQQLNLKLKMLQFELQKYLKITNMDYGIMGIYQYENSSHYLVRGILFLGSKNFNELKNDMESSVELKEWKIYKIDVNDETQKREVQNIWENTLENYNYHGLITCSILYI